MRPLVITGPTAAGKTAAALDIAQRHGAIIVSMDAMQVYRGMNVGTAKVGPEIRARIPHRCIDIRNPNEDFSAADFVVEAEAAIAEGQPVVLCGGTPFYLRAFLMGLVPAPPVDARLRAQFESLDNPHARLVEVDPVLAQRLHPNDRLRVVRGLEFFETSGRRLSEMHDADPRTRRDCEVVWIDADHLYERINNRVMDMVNSGYVDEVRGLLASGYSRNLKSMQSLGYRHFTSFVLGEIDQATAIEYTQRDSRHFAKKQRTFLRGLGFSPGGSVNEAAARAFAASEPVLPHRQSSPLPDDFPR